MTTNPVTPFPLGLMVGGPNGSDPAAEAAVIAQYNRFVATLGATPQFMNAFIDQSQPIAAWAANASWTAWSWRQTPFAANLTPVIGLPMATTADAGQQDAVFKKFASGAYDDALLGIVKSWAAQGYTTLYFRPGYEMNVSSTPWFAGSNAQTQADFVAAFQHIASVLHDAPGASVKVVWNPNIQAGNLMDVTSLYPGAASVDVIAGDIYSPTYPRSLWDWSTRTNDATFAQWFADPVNRVHYWTYPAANQWSPVTDGQSHTLSLQNLIDFAKAQGKPIAIAEAGAGGDGTRGPVDDPAFPQWLASTLAQAGVPVQFVNIWDANPGDGNWDFSNPAAPKPLEAAAWAAAFGRTGPAPVAVGSGPDTIMLQMSEDAYLGDAQFTISVDGSVIGGVQSVTAPHAAGQDEAFAVSGTFGSGSHQVSVTFLNDACGGTASTDRNLYLDGLSYGQTSLQPNLGLYSNGTKTVFLAAAGPDTLVLHLSQDAYGDPAQFSVTLDGAALAGVQQVSALHSQGQTQDFSYSGLFGSGPHRLGVTFLNDAFGGSAATDRNLYVDGATYDGTAVMGAKAGLFNNGTAPITIPGAGAPDTLTFNLSEDAWTGDAQCLLTLDGTSLGGAQTVTASHALGQSQALTFTGYYGPGPHTASISFTNDAWAGPGQDRNLYVQSVAFDGQTTASNAALLWNSTASVALPAAVHAAVAATAMPELYTPAA